MSLDNTVAILETSVYPGPDWGAREFRVQHCFSIGNVYTSKKNIKKYFEKSLVFDTFEDALIYAYELEAKVGTVEHGVLHITAYKDKLWEELAYGWKVRQ